MGFQNIQKCTNLVAFGHGKFYCDGCNIMRSDSLNMCRMQLDYRDSANSKDTNHNVSGNVSDCMNSLALSSKANGERGNIFNSADLDAGRMKRVKLGYR